MLLVEGALLFAASAVRRHQHAAGWAAMPFTVQGSPDGSASGAAGEESRGEVWAPVWTREFTLAEIKQMFAEARASWRGRPARRAVDFYAATRTLGVARGISEFTRYGLQRRNGLAFAAVPLARVGVREQPEVRLAAEVEDWAARFGGSDTSAAVGQAARGFQAAHLAYARDGGALPLARLLAALTGLEQAVGRSGRARDALPVRYAPPARQFLDVLRQAERPELRLAVGLASCATLAGPGQATVPSRTLRQILLPIDPPAPGDRSQPNGRWRDAPLIPGFGSRRLPEVLADVLIWRSRTAAAERGEEQFRGITTFRLGIPVPAADLHAFAAGGLNEKMLGLFLRACLALNWRNVRHEWPPSHAGSSRYHAGPAAAAGRRHRAGRRAWRRAGARAEPGLGAAACRGTGSRRARRSRGAATPGRMGSGAGAAGGERRRRHQDRGCPGPPLPASPLGSFRDRNPDQATRLRRAVMTAYRTVLEAGLAPLAGSLFQPTGFPDLGAAEFERTPDDGAPESGHALIVESAQSMANWLEGTTWDAARTGQVTELGALPYVRVVSPGGDFLSSSRLEAHRLASAYIMNGTVGGPRGPSGEKWMEERLGLVKGHPLDHRAVARACFRLDPVSLLHGVFFARKSWPWQPRIARAVTSFIEASGVRPAVSGGVKRDVVINEAKGGATAEGYGTVPHHRVEYTAATITAYFTVDHAQFGSYGLPEPATALLEALADFEIATLLDHGLRLRTRCDLVVNEVRGERPDAAEAAQRVAKFAADCADELDPVTEVVWSGRGK